MKSLDFVQITCIFIYLDDADFITKNEKRKNALKKIFTDIVDNLDNLIVNHLKIEDTWIKGGNVDTEILIKVKKLGSSLCNDEDGNRRKQQL